MDRILSIDKKAPPLTVLLVQQGDGMPGQGAGSYMADYFHDDRLRQDNARDERPEEWRERFEAAAEDVYNFPDWGQIYQRIYGRDYQAAREVLDRRRAQEGSENDGLPSGRHGEGPNHRALRLWVKDNPNQLFRGLKNVRAETEVELLSADRVDVVVYADKRTIAIEVKSCDSNDNDLQRGIYQCVKYHAVLRAMDARTDAPVQPVLVTETDLPGYLSDLARRLKIKHIKVDLNRTP